MVTRWSRRETIASRDWPMSRDTAVCSVASRLFFDCTAPVAASSATSITNAAIKFIAVLADRGSNFKGAIWTVIGTAF